MTSTLIAFNAPALPAPTPQFIRAAREAVKMTQQEAAELVYRKDSARWREWESGRHQMDSAVWELFLVKSGLRTLKVSR